MHKPSPDPGPRLGELALGIFVVSCLDRRLVTWAWAVNGCTTVIGTIVAVMLAMTFGFAFVAVCATAIYAVGCLALIATMPAARR